MGTVELACAIVQGECCNDGTVIGSIGSRGPVVDSLDFEVVCDEQVVCLRCWRGTARPTRTVIGGC